MKFDPAWLTSAVMALIGSAGFWGWLAERGKRRQHEEAAVSTANATIAGAQAEMVEALNRQSTAFVAALERDRRLLARKVTRLERQVQELQAENQHCQGQYAQAVSRMDGLEIILREHGVPVPGRPPPGSFTVIEGDAATVFQPDNDPPPSSPPKRKARPVATPKAR